MDWGNIVEFTFSAFFGVNAMYFAIAAIGLNVQFGFTGLLNFGQAAFMACGAYAIGMAALYWHVSFWVGIVIGLIYAVILGLIMGAFVSLFAATMGGVPGRDPGNPVFGMAAVVFFPVLYNTLLGVRTAPQILVNALRSLGASRWQVLCYAILPSALPGIITGLRVGAGFAFRGLVFAEMVAAKTGIGYLIFEGTQTQQTARTIVGMVVMGLTWLAIDLCYLRPLERATIERWGLTVDAEQRT